MRITYGVFAAISSTSSLKHVECYNVTKLSVHKASDNKSRCTYFALYGNSQGVVEGLAAHQKYAVFDCMWLLLLSCCMKLKAKIFKRLQKNNSNIINLKWPSKSVRDT